MTNIEQLNAKKTLVKSVATGLLLSCITDEVKVASIFQKLNANLAIMDTLTDEEVLQFVPNFD